MNAPHPVPMPDLQATPDGRALAIDRVGIRGLRYPVRIRAANGSATATVATFDMAVALGPAERGTHMSRFIEVLEAHEPMLDTGSAGRLPGAVLERLGAAEGEVQLRFPWFERKRAPVTGVESLMDYDVCLRAEGGLHGIVTRLQAEVPVTTLCPCSKAISAYGAHNQRSVVAISAEPAAPLNPQDLIAMAERAASCELYGLLKRPDEKYVTERAYENPRFVEDLVRETAAQLEFDARVAAYRVAAENFESIHNHSAYAVIGRDKRAR